MSERRANAVYLPGIRFPARLRVSGDLAVALRDTELVIAAVPSHGTREILKHASPMIHPGTTIVSATKGLEQDTLFRMSEVIEQELGSAVHIAVLSGPSFAREILQEHPTAVVVACVDEGLADDIARLLFCGTSMLEESTIRFSTP